MIRCAILLLAVLTAAACTTRSRKIVVPDHLRASPERQAAAQPQPYSVEINEKGKTWRVTLPPVAGGYEVRIPVDNREPVVPEGTPGPPVPSQDSPEYQLQVEQISALYRHQSYDLARIELDKLLKQFPDDAKLRMMQGSIEWKLGHKDKAREIWEKVIELDPSNAAVLQMLEKTP